MFEWEGRETGLIVERSDLTGMLHHLYITVICYPVKKNLYSKIIFQNLFIESCGHAGGEIAFARQ